MILIIFRPNHNKVVSELGQKVLGGKGNGKMSEEALINAGIIINKLHEKNRYRVKNRKRVPSEMQKNLKSLEEVEMDSSNLPISTISSKCRNHLKSRQSSRGSRHASSSNGNKMIVASRKKGSKAKNIKKLEGYIIPLQKDIVSEKAVPLSTKGKKNNIFLIKHTKITHNPYPGQVNLKKEISRNYKHSKSNSQNVDNNQARNFDDFITANPSQNNNALRLNNINIEHPAVTPGTVYENDENLVIFPKDFNTVKYSQSPFLNKLTNLKAKSRQKPIPMKGHKSRNSMVPKSYTYQRRENDVYYKHNGRKSSAEGMEEGKLIDGSEASNPYMNISPYDNDQMNANFNMKECQNKPIMVNSEKKRAPTVGLQVIL